MQKGDFVRINYIARLESGEIFDLTYEDMAKKEKVHNPKMKYKPVPVVVGAGFVIKGLENALLDINVGEKKTVTINPEDGFGQRDPKMVRVVPRNVFKERDLEPKAGMIVDFSGHKGRIQSASAGRIMVDFNNPLAGKVLKYEVEVVEKIEGFEKEVLAIFEFFGIENAKAKFVDGAVEVETYTLPLELKNKISKLISENVKAEAQIKSVKFIEVFPIQP